VSAPLVPLHTPPFSKLKDPSHRSLPPHVLSRGVLYLLPSDTFTPQRPFHTLHQQHKPTLAFPPPNLLLFPPAGSIFKNICSLSYDTVLLLRTHECCSKDSLIYSATSLPSLPSPGRSRDQPLIGQPGHRCSTFSEAVLPYFLDSPAPARSLDGLRALHFLRFLARSAFFLPRCPTFKILSGRCTSPGRKEEGSPPFPLTHFLPPPSNPKFKPSIQDFSDFGRSSFPNSRSCFITAALAFSPHIYTSSSLHPVP